MVEEWIIWNTPEHVEEDLDDIRGSHPEWNERMFLHWAAETYLKIDHARRSGDLGAVLDCMTASCAKRVRADLAKHGGKLDQAPLELSGVQIEQVGREGTNDFIDVRVVGERDKGLAIEFLRFIRPSYEPDAGAGAARQSVDVCPHCGAHIVDPSDWECEYCGTVLAAQSVGWTIEFILKEGEYAG